MANYTVKQLARLSGVSVRTLHHYDEIGLLKPSFVGENRYRYYGREELLRLQDILFYRELGVPLADIPRLIETDGRDRLAILAEHRTMLADRVKRSRQLLRTIDRTIADIKGEETMTDKDMFTGFDEAKQAEYENWLVDRFGGDTRKRIEASKAGLASLDKDVLAARLAEGKAASHALADAFKAGTEAEDPAIDPLLQRHHAWIAAMWNRECSPQAYVGLSVLYLENADFRATFEREREGFAEWLSAAMKAYAARLEAA
ncbi:MerR family transcriptional regulator [Altererythrobacter salegens]|uniref:MerR family transcriptional regulator n=1 Tax=Croceibacterium salegens TaxID=1737568 RepID=A0A6I4SX79_9SPHN|nr:MerR family transcriptional regulator [Croceibacterium salegens]MXO59637.1 MerR family transcriptional regulator [Croceibacterium salegens]